MKKSRSVKLELLAAAAIISVGCNNNSSRLQRCIDQSNTVVTDQDCDQQDKEVRAFYGPHPYPYYHWYYGGRGDSLGETASDGSYAPPANMTPIRASSPAGLEIIRGGFGSGFFGESGVGE